MTIPNVHKFCQSLLLAFLLPMAACELGGSLGSTDNGGAKSGGGVNSKDAAAVGEEDGSKISCNVQDSSTCYQLAYSSNIPNLACPSGNTVSTCNTDNCVGTCTIKTVSGDYSATTKSFYYSPMAKETVEIICEGSGTFSAICN